jgi:hypothetical protein
MREGEGRRQAKIIEIRKQKKDGFLRVQSLGKGDGAPFEIPRF